MRGVGIKALIQQCIVGQIVLAVLGAGGVVLMRVSVQVLYLRKIRESRSGVGRQWEGRLNVNRAIRLVTVAMVTAGI